ncbi:hypothetical protein CRE_22094 [Caenorhabditis remanei]|uniref:Uncharacterized protein n=1 Tax=Caenorhabditis remanei TaxID=31234 RepID=E3NCM2_CAERE|nr:hypothetical protein CRE_22094 [Caenorhabditis remanei]
MDEMPEYEKEKGVLIRNKRAAPAAATTAGPSKAPPTGTLKPSPARIALMKKRVAGFVTVYASLTGALIVLCFVNIGLFIWLSVTLSKLKKE